MKIKPIKPRKRQKLVAALYIDVKNNPLIQFPKNLRQTPLPLYSPARMQLELRATDMSPEEYLRARIYLSRLEMTQNNSY